MGPLINAGREFAAADRQIHDVQIKTASRAAPVTSLSGGNQQKVVIGKWLNHGATLFIFDEPTVGVDVGTKAEIYRLLGSLLQKGAGIIMISSYLPEVYELADTLHVFRAGGIAASHGHKDASPKTILTEAISIWQGVMTRMSDQTISKPRRGAGGLNVLLSLTLLGLLLVMWLALSVETTTFWTSNNMPISCARAR